MSIGMPDATIEALGEKLPGTLRVGGIEKGKFYCSDTPDEALLQDYWNNHVVSQDGPDEVTAEWQFTFDTVTHSPEGFSGGWMGWMGYNPPSHNDRHVSGNIGIYFPQDHPLKAHFEGLANSIREIAIPSSFPLWVISAALVYLAYKAS